MERKVRRLVGILRVRAAASVCEEGVGYRECERKGQRGGQLRTVTEIEG